MASAPQYGIDIMTKEELTKEIIYWRRRIIELEAELRLANVWFNRSWEKFKERFGE